MVNEKKFEWSSGWEQERERRPGKVHPITTIIFDLDDTLYEEVEYCKSGFSAVARFLHQAMRLPVWLDQDKIYETLYAHFEKGNRTQTFNAAMDELGMDYDEEVIASLIRLYREHRPQIALPQESRDILETLGKRYKLAMLTDGFLPAQQFKVEALGIGGYFTQILYTENLGRSYWKPHTKGFEMLLKKLRERAADCVYVGDNAQKDFIAPNKLGMATIQLVRPSRIHQAAPDDPLAAPGTIIASLTQLPAALKRL
ncbi:MAG: HAD family hydrolase [Sedimentisphaerales bacterium]|nr:HAD family hydrolase [Sedimentisphaerales bacterium]